MTEQTVAMYRFFDDFRRIAHPRLADKRRQVRDAEIMPTAVLSARYVGGNITVAAAYIRQHHGIKSLNKCGMCRHLHRLHNVLRAVFAALGEARKALNTAARYFIVSFAVAGYTDYAAEDLWAEPGQQMLLVARKGNSKRPHHPAQAFLIQHFRKRSETSITALFANKVHIVTAQGFALKWLRFIFAYPFQAQPD